VKAIEEEPHTAYCEPFAGMGGVFFRRGLIPKVEAINDLNRDVATLFRVVQRHYRALLDTLKWQLSSRADFERILNAKADSLTDIERAARFLYLQRIAFGGKVAGRTFGISQSSAAPFSKTKVDPLIRALHRRLEGVWIECLPWRTFVEKWDRPNVLFYVDPPYWGSENYYGDDLFGRTDFHDLSYVLRYLKGRFILSVNDVEPIREIFRWASVEPIRSRYSISVSRHSEARQLLIQAR
jgi:DNA adenine methylase